MSSLPPAAPPLAVPLPVRPGCSVGFMAARAHTRPLNCRVAAPRRCTASLHRGSRALRSPLPLSQVMTEQEGKQSSHLPAAKYFCAQPRSTAAGTTAVTAVDRGRDDDCHLYQTRPGRTVTCIKRSAARAWRTA